MAAIQCLLLDAQNWNIFAREAEAVEAATGRKKKKRVKLTHGRPADSIKQMFFFYLKKKPTKTFFSSLSCCGQSQ